MGVGVRPSVVLGVVEATCGVVAVVTRNNRSGVVVTTTTGAVLSAGLGLDPKVVWTELSGGDTAGSWGPVVAPKIGVEGRLEGRLGTGLLGRMDGMLLGGIGGMLLGVIGPMLLLTGGMLVGRMGAMLLGVIGGTLTGFCFLFPIWKN